jgi:hypothetical protein
VSDSGDLAPDEVADFVGRWAILGGAAATWHLTTAIDWKEMQRVRARHRAYLARYGRQDMLAWLAMPVTMVTEAVRALSELVREENDLQSVEEDHR